MKILVTGATGYFGAEIVRQLLENDEQAVVAMTRSPKKFEQLRRSFPANQRRLQILNEDICSLKYLPKCIEAIIHAAAERDTQKNSDRIIRTNVQGTCNLLRLAARSGVKRFIFISSQIVYGKHSIPWKESMRTDPEGAYALTKYAGEQLVSSFGDVLDWAVLRLSKIYGVSLFMRWDELIGKFVQLIHEKRPLPIHGDGTQKFDLLHIKDAAQSVLHLLYKYPLGWNDIYNIGGGKRITLNMLVKYLTKNATMLDLPPVVVERHPELAPDSLSHWEMDISRARSKLGWNPRQSLKESLKEYLEAYSDKYH